MPAHVNLYSPTVQRARQLEESWPTHGQFPANRSSSRLMTVPCLHGHGAGSAARNGLRADPTFGPFQWRRRLLKALQVQGMVKRKLFIQGIRFCLAQQPYVQMGPRAKRDTFQFQSCSCESLITARTGRGCGFISTQLVSETGLKIKTEKQRKRQNDKT